MHYIMTFVVCVCVCVLIFFSLVNLCCEVRWCEEEVLKVVVGKEQILIEGVVLRVVECKVGM